ncbi:MAG: di-trans,poly-cis-decaprenylcistransferase [Kiritimatiellae bacterium]|nr:di-trans,poly-cis-decaprenylcistransferase [Kiritimatiellia bacterium]
MDSTGTTRPVPRHIAMIMDGNGRWAKKRGNIRLAGHRAGAETVRRVLGYCKRYGIQYLTLYAFSTENWSRPKAEVTGLMKLLGTFLREKEQDLVADECRFRVIGRRADLPENLQSLIARVEESTKSFPRQLIVCLSYGGRAEIADAATRIADDARSGRLAAGAIDEKTFASYLYAPDVPDPDLILRTSGEFRLSNFLLWEAAYSELYVTPVLWPDFEEKDFVAALDAYAMRSRRFGGVDAVAAPKGNTP